MALEIRVDMMLRDAGDPFNGESRIEPWQRALADDVRREMAVVEKVIEESPFPLSPVKTNSKTLEEMESEQKQLREDLDRFEMESTGFVPVEPPEGSADNGQQSSLAWKVACAFYRYCFA